MSDVTFLRAWARMAAVAAGAVAVALSTTVASADPSPSPTDTTTPPPPPPPMVATGPAPGPSTGPAPSASAANCPDVDVVFARGTNEPGGAIGRVGQAFADRLQFLVPTKTVSTYAVEYPASLDFLTTADGAVDASRHIRGMSLQCPDTRIVLGGYSQGAAVMDMLIGLPPLGNKIDAIGSKLGDIGAAAPLAPDLAGKIAAIALFGNPAAKFSNPANSAPPPFGARAVDFCKDGDPICSRGRNPFAHNGYETSDFIDDAAGFVAAFV